MRKTPLIILLILVLANVNAAYVHETTRHFDLQAGYGATSSINITPIPAQSQSYVVGMPFSIEDQLVTDKSGVGREIATFTLLSNVDFNIIIGPAEPHDGKMRHVDENGEPAKKEDGTYEHEGLDYILTFRYLLGYVGDGNSQSSRESEFTYESRNGTEIISDLTIGYTGEENDFIGTANGAIFFRFDDKSSDMIEDPNNTLPAGDYMAHVKITLEAKK